MHICKQCSALVGPGRGVQHKATLYISQSTYLSDVKHRKYFIINVFFFLSILVRDLRSYRNEADRGKAAMV